MAVTSQHLIDIHPATGEYVQGWDRGKVSIATILGTRFNTRLMREWFGSDFIDLQDKPLSQEVLVDSIIAAVESVNTFEPEFKVTSMAILRANAAGEIEIRLTVTDLVSQRNHRLTQVL